MTFSLNKKDSLKIQAAISKLKDCYDDLSNAITNYNEALKDAMAECEKVASDFRNEFEDKSESWQDSDRGQEVAEMIGAWEQLDFDREVDLPDIDMDQFNDLEGL